MCRQLWSRANWRGLVAAAVGRGPLVVAAAWRGPLGLLLPAARVGGLRLRRTERNSCMSFLKKVKHSVSINYA